MMCFIVISIVTIKDRQNKQDVIRLRIHVQMTAGFLNTLILWFLKMC